MVWKAEGMLCKYIISYLALFMSSAFKDRDWLVELACEINDWNTHGVVVEMSRSQSIHKGNNEHRL